MGKYNKLEVQGMDELLKTLKKMHDAPEKVSKQALNKAGEDVKKVEMRVAKEAHDKFSEDVGYKEIKKYGVRTRRQGGQYVDIGFRSKLTSSQKKKDQANKKAGKSRPTHWDKVKGLKDSPFIQKCISKIPLIRWNSLWENTEPSLAIGRCND